MTGQAGASWWPTRGLLGLSVMSGLLLQCAPYDETSPAAPMGDDGVAGGGGAAGFGGKGGAAGALPVDTRPVVSAARTPPPISGGTLLALPEGRAILSDPDRDRIVTVDLTARARLAEIQLANGDEPSRLVADADGIVHVVLRGTGELASVDPTRGELLERRKVCRAPRGVAFDAEADALVVACLEGTLVELPAEGGEALRTTFVAPDLRDVVFLGTTLVASRFRSAELLYLDEERTITKTVRPLDASPQFAATTAWRMVPTPNGELVIAHQRALDSTIDVGGGDQGTGGTGSGDIGIGGASGSGSGYGNAFDPCASIVQSTTSVAAADGSIRTHGTIPGIALPVDVAVGNDGTIAVANGAMSSLFGTQSFVQFYAASTSIAPGDCGVPVVRTDFHGTVTSVAFDESGRLLTLTREPSTLWIDGDPHETWSIPLGGADVTDTGHELFHADTGSNIACASCHAEGTDDGHVWNFSDVGARRTQPLDVGLAGLEPFHWDGSLVTFGSLVHEVFERRMGGPSETPERITALERYVHSLGRRPALRVADEASERGKLLFETEEIGCAACHSGPKFTNGLTESIGKGNATQVPSLVGVSTRAPLMHDGCAKTLRDRFDPVCGGERHGDIDELDEADLDDLIAYLETL